MYIMMRGNLEDLTLTLTLTLTPTHRTAPRPSACAWTQEKLDFAFDMYDLDGNGLIERVELVQVPPPPAHTG